MSKPLLTVVLPSRDRSGVRLSACLASLRWQDLPADDVEIVLSDFGSGPEHRASLAELADQYGCRLVRTETTELWNRSRALNVGIQHARAEHVLCSDVDILFAPSFLPTVLEELSKGRAFVVCRCRDLPADVPERVWARDDFPGLLARSTFRQFPGTGACQATRRDWMIRVRGYDERYVFWGYEDRDMVLRARCAGLRVVWIHERTAMLHQWHRKMNNDVPWLKYRNKARYFLTGFVVRKNRAGWGAWVG